MCPPPTVCVCLCCTWCPCPCPPLLLLLLLVVFFPNATAPQWLVYLSLMMLHTRTTFFQSSTRQQGSASLLLRCRTLDQLNWSSLTALPLLLWFCCWFSALQRPCLVCLDPSISDCKQPSLFLSRVKSECALMSHWQNEIWEPIASPLGAVFFCVFYLSFSFLKDTFKWYCKGFHFHLVFLCVCVQGREGGAAASIEMRGWNMRRGGITDRRRRLLLLLLLLLLLAVCAPLEKRKGLLAFSITATGSRLAVPVSLTRRLALVAPSFSLSLSRSRSLELYINTPVHQCKSCTAICIRTYLES